MDGPTIAATRVIDAVYERLRHAVLEGRLKPGDQLSVPWIARELNVSRGSAREAALQLVGDGLAQERPRRGVVVVAIDRDEVAKIHQVREALEGYASRLCADAASSDLLRLLHETLQAQREAIEGGDATGYAETDRRFHSLIAQSCGNSELALLIGRLHARMRIALVQVAGSSEHRCRGHEEHLEILDAIQRQDADEAEAAMRRHIGRTRRTISELASDA